MELVKYEVPQSFFKKTELSPLVWIDVLRYYYYQLFFLTQSGLSGARC